MTTVYPTDTDSWQDPAGSDALSTSPDGRTHADHHTDLNDVVLEMEAQLVGRAFTSSAAYSDTAAVVVDDAESLTPVTGAWAALSPHLTSVPALDAVNFSTGANSVTCDLNYPTGSSTNGKLYFDLVTPIAVGSHTALTIDVRFHVGNGSGAEQGFRAAVSDGAALTGTVVASDVTQDSDFSNLWFTLTIPLAGLTTVKSVGIEKSPTHSGTSSKWVTWWIDNIVLREATAVDAALESVAGAVVVPADYVASEEQFTDTYSSVRSVLDLRPAHANLAGIGGVYNLRDWRLDETGTNDVTEDLQRIFDSLADNTTIEAPSTAIYRIDNTVTLGEGQRQLTFDGRGCRFYQPTEVNTALFNIAGTENTIRGVRGFSLNTATNDGAGLAAGDATHPVVGTPTVNGTGCELNGLNEQVELGWRDDDEIAYFARDHLGINRWDFVLSDSNQVASDCKFTVMEPDGTVLQTTTQTLTGTPTTYQVTYTPDNLYLPLRVAVSKATATANTITLASTTQYGRQRYDADLAFNHLVHVNASAVSSTVEDCWAEGMGGDMVTTAGAIGIMVRRCTARVVGRQGISFNAGSNHTMRDCEIIASARHSMDFEPETANVFVTDITIENCRFVDPGLGHIAATGWPRVRRVHIRGCTFLNTSDRGGAFLTGGWWEGTLANCSFVRRAPGPFGSFTFQGRGATLSNITCTGGLTFETGTKNDENGLSMTTDYNAVQGWRAYDPLTLFTSAITNYSQSDMIALNGSYGQTYP